MAETKYLRFDIQPHDFKYGTQNSLYGYRDTGWKNLPCRGILNKIVKKLLELHISCTIYCHMIDLGMAPTYSQREDGRIFLVGVTENKYGSEHFRNDILPHD